ncbi:uncharacterized protein BDV14DRAFT_179398 [Aspergillus stella-maris]|uniref:uncharacterized protein n=1 Tax=Aspergillus stella-maris TaxID=1810926 RepID=UPI003CCCBA22
MSRLSARSKSTVSTADPPIDAAHSRKLACHSGRRTLKPWDMRRCRRSRFCLFIACSMDCFSWSSFSGWGWKPC